MNKLFVFGCSHSTGDYNLDDINQAWPTILSNKLNLILENYAISGYSNDDIFVSIFKNINKINNSDTVLVFLTFPERVKINKDTTLLPSRDKDEWWYKIVNDDYFYELQFIKIFLAIQSLLKDKNYKITFVDPSILIKSEFYNKNILTNTFLLPKITLSKSFSLGDDARHLGAKGHIKIAEFFYNKITSFEQVEQPDV